MFSLEKTNAKNNFILYKDIVIKYNYCV